MFVSFFPPFSHQSNKITNKNVKKNRHLHQNQHCFALHLNPDTVKLFFHSPQPSLQEKKKKTFQFASQTHQNKNFSIFSWKRPIITFTWGYLKQSLNKLAINITIVDSKNMQLLRTFSHCCHCPKRKASISLFEFLFLDEPLVGFCQYIMCLCKAVSKRETLSWCSCRFCFINKARKERPKRRDKGDKILRIQYLKILANLSFLASIFQMTHYQPTCCLSRQF